MDDSILKLSGAPEPADKFTPLAVVKWIGGLQTQRSVFASIDTRYNSKFLGGKPDALWDGLNVEISNHLTPQRRPGLLAYGTTSIAPPKAFYDWELATTDDLILVVDTSVGGINNAGQIIRYSPTYAGTYVDKGLLSEQTNFFDVVNTLYLGNGIDRYKIVGPNLLTQSNTFGIGSGTSFSIEAPWTEANIFALTGEQLDPLGTMTATQVVWGTTGSTAYLQQNVSPNYTPVNNNTFTFSIWMMETGGPITVNLKLSDVDGVIVDTPFNLTNQWVKYQITGTMGPGLSGLNHINVELYNPTTTNTMVIYGAQLEVGGPATTTQITTTKPQGVWLWGIQAPLTAPTMTFSNQVGNTGQPWQSNHNYTVGQTIVDSNGNIQYVITAGESGTAEPVWSEQQTTVAAANAQIAAEEPITGSTVDGAQNSVIQSVSNFVSASTITLALPANVTPSNTLLAFVFGDAPGTPAHISISDGMGNLWTLVAQSISGNFQSALYTVRSAAAGATSVTVTFSSPSSTSVWLALAEVNALTGLDVSNTNTARDYSGTVFNTGVVTTTHAREMLVSFAVFGNNVDAGHEIGSPPTGFSVLASQSGVQGRTVGHFLNLSAAFEFLSNIVVINPSWSIANPGLSNGITGITAGFQTSLGTLVWVDLGPVGAGLSPKTGYQYYYAFMNSYTGHVSNVSPISVSTGVQTGQIISVFGVGMQITPSGPYGQDPQVDMIAVFRDTDGGGFWYQIAQFANPGTTSSAGTWELNDIAPDNGMTVSTTIELNGTPSTITEALNTGIYAPIALLNSIPPSGIIAMDYFEGRMWGAVENILYYNTAADNAALLNIQQNGVPSESWGPANVVPFNAPIIRLLALGGGLLVFTTNDLWVVEGTNLLTGGFNPRRILVNHGIRSYNAVSVDGSSAYVYTSDREFLIINPNSGSVEMGYPIGDVLEDSFVPSNVYVARHVAGSRDNAVFLADGSQGWFRLNPNQQGASMAGEATPVWSPKADFTQTLGGIGAVASIETQPGITQLLVGTLTIGPVLVRNLDTFGDYSPTAMPGPPILPVIRGTGLQLTTAQNFTVAWPAGTQAGDLAIISGAIAYNLVGLSAPAGWTLNYYGPGQVWNGLTISRILNSADISAGSVTIQTVGTFEGTFAIVTMVGAPAIRENYGSSLQPNITSLSTTSAVTNADIAIAFGSTRLNPPPSSIGFSLGTLVATVTDSSQVTAILVKALNLPGGMITEEFVYAGGYNAQTLVIVEGTPTFIPGTVPYNWFATIGSIILANPGKLAEVESITTEMDNSIGYWPSGFDAATQCGVEVLLDEIAGPFENLPDSVNDPPQLAPSATVLSNRFYLSQGTDPPILRHLQIKLVGGAVTTKDEVLSITIRGALVPEQA